MITKRWIVVAAFCCLPSLIFDRGATAQDVPAEAQDGPAAEQDGPEKAQQVPDALEQEQLERMEKLIQNLESSRFSERARAAQELERFGAHAVESLEEVIRSGSYEAADRAMGILKRNFQNEDPLIADPAKDALQRIADTKNHPKSDAAKRILTPAEPEPSPNRRILRPRLIPPMPVRQNIQIQVKSVNGRKDIRVTENGRKFRFSDEEEGIAVERPDDKGGVKKAKYKDAAEMKKKDPEAHKIYERYSKGAGNQIRIQIGGQIRGLPLQPGMQLRPRIQIQPRRVVPERPAAPPDAPKPAPAPTPKVKDGIEV